MKLNYKRTIFVGFAFFLICSFWQAYDNTIPLILTNKFGMSQAWSGVIMALDNVLALFMLPLFGAISDRHRGKRGRRTPFIVVGTLIAAVMLIALSFVDNAQLRHLSDVSAIDDPAALEQIYDHQADETLLTPGGDKFVLSQKFTQEEFIRIRSQVEQDGKTVTNPDYTNYVVPARQACAWDATAKSPATLVFFIVLLLIVLVSMAVFRSPAVALMPDVTLKPLRSKANAVINLMGSAGGILVLALGMVFATSAVRNSLMSYTGYFAVIAAIMLSALVIFMLTVREKEWAYEMQQQAVALGIEEETQEQEESAGGRKLSVDEVKSLIFLLLSIVLWFFGYNAVTSKYSVYASNILHKDYNLTLIIAQAAAIVSYLPVGFIASKAGRKKDHPGRRGHADHRLHRGRLPQRRKPHHADERHVRPGRYRLGHHQRQLLPHGGGDVLRRRRGQIYRLLLHRLHGRPGGHAYAVRSADGPLRHACAVPLRRRIHDSGLRHHAVRPPWRQQAPGQDRSGSSGRDGGLTQNARFDRIAGSFDPGRAFHPASAMPPGPQRLGPAAAVPLRPPGLSRQAPHSRKLHGRLPPGH